MRSAYAARRPVVLIVEDDFLIRLHAAQIIEEAEFDVIEASNADEVAILEGRADITVLFTDIQMPGNMDGLKLAAAVKGRWPPIKIVATSGVVHERPAVLPEGGRFLPKPYSPTQLAATLREITADR
jgi:CheY-like chemotaxis protein